MNNLNTTPTGERIHIGLFGCRNAGKSSLINALTGQSLAVVSNIPGTTTDPVAKAMELLPLGPILLIDTGGLDDSGDLGHMRVQKAWQILNKTDIALVIIDATQGIQAEDKKLLQRIREKELSCIVVFTKSELADAKKPSSNLPFPHISVSAVTGQNIDRLKELLAQQLPIPKGGSPLCADLVRPGHTVLLVTPIDSAAPKGRLILPQQQTIREIIDAGACALITQEDRLQPTLDNLKTPPALVITDSQVFKRAAKDTPEEIPLTSFSILMARHKGNLVAAFNGIVALKHLQDNDRVLISEGCTHRRQCSDIGTVKLPAWIRKHTNKTLQFTWTSGIEFPPDLSPYKLIIHCGGCMLNEREMQYRYRCAANQKVPITNYGLCIAYTQGILKRALGLFPELAKKL